MLNAKIFYKDCLGPWSYQKGVYESGSSRITIVNHPALVSHAISAFGMTIIFSAEASFVNDAFVSEFFESSYRICSDYQQFTKAIRSLSVSYIMISIYARQGYPYVDVHTGSAPQNSLLFRSTSEFLCLSGSIADLMEGESSVTLDLRQVARYLLLNLGSKEFATILVGVERLPVTGVVEFSLLGFRRKCHTIYASFPRKAIRSNVDFGKHLSALIARHFLVRKFDIDKASFELSGGLDSAFIALSSAPIFGPLNTCGIEMIGDTRKGQISRRDALCKRISATDSRLDLKDYVPSFHEGWSNENFSGDFDDIYADSYHALLSQQRSLNRHWMISGLAGDEVFPLFVGESKSECVTLNSRPDPSYYTGKAIQLNSMHDNLGDKDYSCVPVIFSLISQKAAKALRSGVWLLTPFADPEVIQFCNSLPQSARSEKSVLREFILNAGFPEFKSYDRETFVNAMWIAAFKHFEQCASVTENSELVSLGLIDKVALEKELGVMRRFDFETLKSRPELSRRLDHVAAFLHVELYLRHLRRIGLPHHTA